RAISQAGLYPSNCRLLDPAEAALTGSAKDGRALLVLGFESADHPVESAMERALECAADHGGQATGHRPQATGSGSDGVSTWRQAFLQAPYLRDTIVAAGVLSETFETAITWDRIDDFVTGVKARAESALHEAYGAG